MDLSKKQCMACEGGIPRLARSTIDELLKELNHWELDDNGKDITKTFQFKNYYQTMAFVNAVAFIAHQENHHPDLIVKYNQCIVSYTTHAIDGLSENDFICAAKIDQLAYD